MMTKRQQSYLVESVEEGVKRVRDSGRVAVIAGRETLFFDIQRFGLSSKLNPGNFYGAIISRPEQLSHQRKTKHSLLCYSFPARMSVHRAHKSNVRFGVLVLNC